MYAVAYPLATTESEIYPIGTHWSLYTVRGKQFYRYAIKYDRITWSMNLKEKASVNALMDSQRPDFFG